MVDARGLDPRFAPSVRLSAVQFLSYTSAEIQRISRKPITNPNTLDSLLHPNKGGLYDPALGPSDKHDLCDTCGLNFVHCPGHFGHIPLPLPVYHPVFFANLYSLLKISCWNCHMLFCSPYRAHLLAAQLELIELGLLSEAVTIESEVGADMHAEELDEILRKIRKYVRKCKRNSQRQGPALVAKTKNLVKCRNSILTNFVKCSDGAKTCMYCLAPARLFRHENGAKIFLRGLSKKLARVWMEARSSAGQDSVEGVAKKAGDLSMDTLTKQSYLTPLEVREHVGHLWENQRPLVNALIGCSTIAKGGERGEANRGVTTGDKEGGGADRRVTTVDEEGGGKVAATVARCTGEISPVDVFFLDVIPVPPSRFRPTPQMGEKRFENHQSMNLNRVLTDAITIEALMAEKKLAEVEEEAESGVEPQAAETPKKGKKDTRKKLSFSQRLQMGWVRLQTAVNCLMDSSSDKTAKVAPNGIKQILEKKEGLFRNHMMGKRVDFAARSVISPDPYINMDEIGIPLVFARKLTYPQPVTHWNVRELRKAVINGPNVHPGATHVQNEDGSVVLLNASNSVQRLAIAKKLLTPSKEGMLGGAAKKVFRHLKNGDVLILNRQPTLHKPSIMAHKARVLPGEKTLRLHYANCKSYNADFDGDEMNAHFPQNELARAEGYGILFTHHQYLVPKDGTPLSGLIQDHVVSGLLMTLRGRMFNRLDSMHLLFSSLPQYHGSFRTLPPCIVKPEKLWSGKQIVSMLLLNVVPEDKEKLNLVSRARISVREWCRTSTRQHQSKNRKLRRKMKYSDESMMESEVVFCQGELLCGVLDKSQFGASQYGFVHSCYELYGGAVANLLLSALGRLFTTYLQFHGFTMGVEDILVRPEADATRLDLMGGCCECGPEATAEALGVDNLQDRDLLCEKYESAHRSMDPSAIKSLDYSMKKKTDQFNNAMNTACVPAGLHKPFPLNSLQLMVQAGAKGSTVNCMQISSLLGQIELEGQRPPMMASGRFLPSFLPYDLSPRAGGFVDGRFLTGIPPQEYFYHCMAGREGLVDTAVKTSRSGYLQRCLIKHLEGLCVGYDMTVRDSDGSVVQFLYGEDGMDIAKTRFLTDKQFPFLIDNYQSICDQLDPESAIAAIDSGKAARYQRKVNRWAKRTNHLLGSPRKHYSAFLNFYEKHLPELEMDCLTSYRDPKAYYRTDAELRCIEQWRNMSPMARQGFRKTVSREPIPVNAHLRPDRHFGSISHKMSQTIQSFLRQHPDKISSAQDASPSNSVKVSSEMFESLVHFKCLRALVDPGEAVGLLAAQSIGEPSTQMTLNTFHFAGRGEMNVTLGIPRLREILMTASPNIKTPSMDVPLWPNGREGGERLKKIFTRVCLDQVLEKAEVWETIARNKGGYRHRRYQVKLSFLPPEYYKDDFVVSPESIIAHVEEVFLKKLVGVMNREIKIIKQRRKNLLSVQAEAETEKSSSDDPDSPELPPSVDYDDDDDLSDAEETEGVDATSAKLLAKKQEHASYEDAGESDDEAMEGEAWLSGVKEEVEEDEAMEGAWLSGVKVEMEEDEAVEVVSGVKEEMEEEDMDPGQMDMSRMKDSSSDDMSDDDIVESMLVSRRRRKKHTAMDMDRVRAVLCIKGGAIVDYSYDTAESLWCQATLRVASLDAKVMLTSTIQKVAAKSVVWETPNIKQGFLSESSEPGEGGMWRLKTDGVNLQELWRHESVLDLNRAYTNNIHAMAGVYGIEAACKAIIKEISGVFKVYGIAVDYRHLSLIADYMTFEGSYKPFNRFGMENNSSPFQKMSFETTMHFLQTATIAGEKDPILSPSACLVAGRVVKGGTGCVDLLQKLC